MAGEWLSQDNQKRSRSQVRSLNGSDDHLVAAATARKDQTCPFQTRGNKKLAACSHGGSESTAGSCVAGVRRNFAKDEKIAGIVLERRDCFARLRGDGGLARYSLDCGGQTVASTALKDRNEWHYAEGRRWAASSSWRHSFHYPPYSLKTERNSGRVVGDRSSQMVGG